MWKNRDTDELNNRMQFFKGEKYSFLALVNSYYKDDAGRAWAGNNDVGFCIMNTASYNLQDTSLKGRSISAGRIMYRALEICRTLEDFENMLDTLPRPIGVESNYGVIDADGGAAYYEVNNAGWSKIDVNDPKIAPQGFLVYTNYSYTGRLDEGMGYIRYSTADRIFGERVAAGGAITPQWIFNSLSRSFYHSLLDIDLRESEITGKGSGFFIDQDFIPRKSSSSAILFRGVKENENPLETVTWVVLGYPPVSVAVPLFIKAGAHQPFFMGKREGYESPILSSAGVEQKPENSVMCDLALALKEKVFPIHRGNGEKYFNFRLLYNEGGTGFMQVLEVLEDEIVQKSGELVSRTYGKGYSKEIQKEYDSYYDAVFDSINRTYESLF